MKRGKRSARSTRCRRACTGCETRTTALEMLFAQEPEQREILAELEGALNSRTGDVAPEIVRELIGRWNARGGKLDFHERRLSRHADHLGALEKKMQSVLRKVGGE
jgi:hypothetical protein